MTPTLYIVRGLPGAGKSTFAKRMLDTKMADAHFEADMYFEKDGKYQFDPGKLNAAHMWCRNEVEKALHDGRNVVVSNTFTKHSEMYPYIHFCKSNGYHYKVIRLETNYGSIHNVPPESIAKMKARFQDYPEELVING